MVLTLRGYIQAYGPGRLWARRDSAVTRYKFASRDVAASKGANWRTPKKRDVVVARIGAVHGLRVLLHVNAMSCCLAG